MLVKVVKNKAYYKRIQTKYRRRREGKTDYHARRKMVKQDKNKYNTPKYRLVVRITNKRVITQVCYSTIMGDRVISQAQSTELAKFDIPSGYTNYAACYATGLLAARRCLQAVGMDKDIEGKEELDGEEFHVEDEHTGEKRPFRVILDVGLSRTISGQRCFAVLKGAVDGGLHIPHNVRKFPGYTEPEERGEDYQYDASVHLERILGAHVKEYMADLEEEDQERYKVQFSKNIEAGKESDDLEDMYTEAHAAIRENPSFTKKEHSGITNRRNGNKITTSNGTEYVRKVKISKKEKMNRVAQKIANAQAKMQAAAEGEEEE